MEELWQLRVQADRGDTSDKQLWSWGWAGFGSGRARADSASQRTGDMPDTPPH